ncbi:glycosyltransferase family 2 protein [Photobacterium sp. TLY01]|uniref:glycosyltransferase family 2 protein n=1 Tax=Photobacterium sp. TLY01 TaxID=2907534 RepID=UPI001F21B8A9|nr:glycosyltransferase family 2 protein [Photobacterium sp. TLY01]UIP27203.1 glycosyltransferase family 2 protein [Photobacterium sp. TLY01]
MNKIDIVLATYNGEKYLREQLESIQHCDGYSELIHQLIIIDDGSTDSTASLIESAQAEDSKIRYYPFDGKKRGAAKNFSRGVQYSQAEYIMFSDQDDVWNTNKIRDCFNAICKEVTATPCLVFTDVQIVDENLEVISESYFSLKNIGKDWYASLSNLAQQNVVSGCTTLFNRALLSRAFPIPDSAYMHDWWLALIASVEGKIIFLDQPTIRYRQHANNTIGARKKRIFLIHQVLPRFVKSMDSVVLQAKTLVQRYPELSDNSTLSTLASLESLSFTQRMKCLLDKILYRSNVKGSIGLLIYLIFYSSSLSKRLLSRNTTD